MHPQTSTRIHLTHHAGHDGQGLVGQLSRPDSCALVDLICHRISIHTIDVLLAVVERDGLLVEEMVAVLAQDGQRHLLQLSGRDPEVLQALHAAELVALAKLQACAK